MFDILFYDWIVSWGCNELNLQEYNKKQQKIQSSTIKNK